MNAKTTRNGNNESTKRGLRDKKFFWGWPPQRFFPGVSEEFDGSVGPMCSYITKYLKKRNGEVKVRNSCYLLFLLLYLTRKKNRRTKEERLPLLF